jgi:hypothetical protein
MASKRKTKKKPVRRKTNVAKPSSTRMALLGVVPGRRRALPDGKESPEILYGYKG